MNRRRPGPMGNVLGAGDADQLRDLADRYKRGAATARDSVPGNPGVAEHLTALAMHASAAAAEAVTIADIIDPDGADGDDSQAG